MFLLQPTWLERVELFRAAPLKFYPVVFYQNLDFLFNEKIETRYGCANSLRV
jgi:hypothetical protein